MRFTLRAERRYELLLRGYRPVIETCVGVAEEAPVAAAVEVRWVVGRGHVAPPAGVHQQLVAVEVQAVEAWAEVSSTAMKATITYGAVYP